MRIIRRIVIAIGILFVAQYFIAPAVVLYFVKKAPTLTRLVPMELKDLTVSQTAGTKLSYLGYEFEVPWGDLDESRTQVSDNKKGVRTAWLHFRSGLKLFLSTTTAPGGFPEYAFLKQTYAITPDQIDYWTLFKGGHYRDARFLMAKSVFLEGTRLGSDANPAETGIFDLQGSSFKGFQYGDPQKWKPPQLKLSLFAGDTRVDVWIFQNHYDDPMGVTQPEINRIVQSLHRTEANAVATSTTQ